MKEAIDAKDLLDDWGKWQIADVRSPGEFNAGHIPGAVNIPLFTDEERAKVGTLYTQVSQEEAFREALTFAGQRMQSLVDDVKQLRASSEKDFVIHCWRGGQRSKAVQWLVNFSGNPSLRLDGGYKSFRTTLHSFFNDFNFDVRILGGYTGAGKTEVLKALVEKGQQVIDLEAMANHKGSAFGSIGETTQPTSEQFENNIFQRCLSFDSSRPVWIENESRSIGKAHLPEGLWGAMKKSMLYHIDVIKEVRLQRILMYYGEPVNLELLLEAFDKIHKRLGGLDYQHAIKALHTGDLDVAASIALKYYDKAYLHQLESWPKERIKYVSPSIDVEETAEMIIQLI